MIFCFLFFWNTSPKEDYDEDLQEEPIDWDETPLYDVIILGSGPAGSTAAIYTAQAGFSTLVIHGELPGGQLSKTTEVINFPTFKGTGPELVKAIEMQATEYGAEYRFDTIVKTDLKSFPRRLTTANGEGLRCRSLIIATGGRARMLGLESEHRLMGRGICTCAHCDGHLFKGKSVVVVGGGMASIHEALYLSKICSNVTLVSQSSKLRTITNMDETLSSNGIKVITNIVVKNITGTYGVSGVTLFVKINNRMYNICCSGVFISIGQIPETSIFRDVLPVNKNGYFITDGTPKTKIPGVFVAGDCTSQEIKQAVTAAGDGCKAGIYAAKYLQTL